ncbi:MAG: NUDIX hydrolase [Bacteroidota bacterium]
MKYKWLDIARELQAIAQEGLTYTEGGFDRIRYQRLRRISTEIMRDFTDTEMEKVIELFASGTRYPTPKVDIRAAVFRDEKILMVREEDNGRWSLPGGWADIGLTPSENAVKEVHEETGLEVRPVRLIAVWDKKMHPHPPEPDYAYKFCILCEEMGGELRTSIETSAVDFFGEDALPELSDNRNTEGQIRFAFQSAREDLNAVVD